MAVTNREYFSDDLYPLQRLTGRIIHASHRVHRTLGYGFSEVVYRRALAVELQFMGLAVSQEVPYEVVYRGVVVGVYQADMVVESAVIVETKTGLVLDPATHSQLLNYLSAAKLPVGLICHFGPRPQVKRMVRSEHVATASRAGRKPGSIDSP